MADNHPRSNSIPGDILRNSCSVALRCLLTQCHEKKKMTADIFRETIAFVPHYGKYSKIISRLFEVHCSSEKCYSFNPCSQEQEFQHIKL